MADGLDVCWRHVEHALGITYRQLDYWTRQGHLKPRQDAPSSGVPRKWPLAELEVARRMARLTDAGLAVERAAAFARESWPKGEIAAGVTLAVTETAP
jgi:DNA-binding transcriptional MerR regulator